MCMVLRVQIFQLIVFQAKSDLVTTEQLQEEEGIISGSKVEVNQSNKRNGDSQSSKECLQHQVTKVTENPTTRDQNTMENTAMLSSKDANDANDTNDTNDWLEGVNEILRVTAIQAMDYAVNQHHRLQQCMKEKTEVINSALANPSGSEEKHKSIDQIMMVAQREMEKVRRALTMVLWVVPSISNVVCSKLSSSNENFTLCKVGLWKIQLEYYHANSTMICIMTYYLT